VLLSIGQERRVRALAVPPNPVEHLDRIYRCVGTMKEHKQSSEADRTSARIIRRCGHDRSVPGYRPLDLSVCGFRATDGDQVKQTDARRPGKAEPAGSGG
jgi:hypothetical protein